MSIAELKASLIHSILYSWKKYIKIPVKLHNHDCERDCIGWAQFESNHRNEIMKITYGIVNATFTEHREKTIWELMHNVRSSTSVQDLEICKRMCYDGDKIIKICTTEKNGIIVISHFGTIILKVPGNTNIAKFGTLPHCDAMKGLIENINPHIDCGTLIEMLKDFEKLSVLIRFGIFV